MDDEQQAAAQRQLEWAKFGGLSEFSDPKQRHQIWHGDYIVDRAEAALAGYPGQYNRERQIALFPELLETLKSTLETLMHAQDALLMVQGESQRQLDQLNSPDLDTLLVNAIDQWMKAESGKPMMFAHGNAQGIARALGVLRATDFTTQWSRGLDMYQNNITLGRYHV